VAGGSAGCRKSGRLTAAVEGTDRSIVLYFYEKQQELLQCEVLDTEVPDTYAIVLTEQDGRVRTHYVKGSNDAHRLWLALEQQLRATGWTGPVGQDLTVRKFKPSPEC
jgi:hypothetical protein